jgi:hypothetical protein
VALSAMECHFEPLSATSSAGQENGGRRPAGRTPLFPAAGCRSARRALVALTKKKNVDEVMSLDDEEHAVDDDDESGTGGTSGALPNMRPGARRALLSRFDAAPGEEDGEAVFLSALKLNVKEVYGDRRALAAAALAPLSAIERH